MTKTVELNGKLLVFNINEQDGLSEAGDKLVRKIENIIANASRAADFEEAKRLYEGGQVLGDITPTIRTWRVELLTKHCVRGEEELIKCVNMWYDDLWYSEHSEKSCYETYGKEIADSYRAIAEYSENIRKEMKEASKKIQDLIKVKFYDEAIDFAQSQCEKYPEFYQFRVMLITVKLKKYNSIFAVTDDIEKISTCGNFWYLRYESELGFYRRDSGYYNSPYKDILASICCFYPGLTEWKNRRLILSENEEYYLSEAYKLFWREEKMFSIIKAGIIKVKTTFSDKSRYGSETRKHIIGIKNGYNCEMELWFNENGRKKVEEMQKMKLMRERIAAKCCQYCGGKFKGLFKKVCSKCGIPKDY